MQKILNTPIMIVLIISQLFLSACGSEDELYFEETQTGGNQNTDGLAATYGGTIHNGLRLNDLAVLEKIVVPHVAEKIGVEEISSGGENFYDYSGWGPIPSVSIGMKSFDMDINIDGNTADFDITPDRYLKSIFNLENWDPTLITYLRVGYDWGSFEINPEFSIEDLKISLLTTLKANTTKHRVQIGHIKELEVELSGVVLFSKGIIWLYNAACHAIDWFFPSMCDDGDDCISSILNSAMRSHPIAQKTLKQLINDTLDTALQISGEVSLSEHRFTYHTGLSSVRAMDAPKDVLFTQWPTVLEGTFSAPTTSCGATLYHEEPTAYYNIDLHPPDDEDPLGAIDLVVPYGLLADAVVLLAKSGKFCKPHTFDCGSAELNFKLEPKGLMRIFPGKTPDYAHLEMPFRINLFEGDVRLPGTLHGAFSYELRGEINAAKQEFNIRFGPPSTKYLDGEVETPCGTIFGDGMVEYLNSYRKFF